MTVTLHKRSLNPAESSLTWEEVNENWRILEDYLNSNVSIIGHQGPQGVQGDRGERGYQGYKGNDGYRGFQGTTFTPSYDIDTGEFSWRSDNPYVLTPATAMIRGAQGTTGSQGKAGAQEAVGAQRQHLLHQYQLV